MAKFRTLISFSDREDKEKIFDTVIAPILGDNFKSRWIDDDKTYYYGIDGEYFFFFFSKGNEKLSVISDNYIHCKYS